MQNENKMHQTLSFNVVNDCDNLNSNWYRFAMLYRDYSL